MIYLYLGKPGGGKSYGALKAVVEELLYGNRLICTNLALDVPALNEFMQEAYPKWKDDINHRLRILKDNECRMFYLTRTIDNVLIPRSLYINPGQKEAYPEFEKRTDNGVVYILDEAHIFFDAREWAVTGLVLTYYNTQHRKLCDDVIFITQFPKLVDGRIRELCQTFRVFSNQGMRKMLTFFSGPKMFISTDHPEIPTAGHKGDTDATHYYRLNLKLAQCYDTSAGVGVIGRRKPEKSSPRALAWYWLAIPLLIAAVLFVKSPVAIEAVMNWFMNRASKVSISDVVPSQNPDARKVHASDDPLPVNTARATESNTSSGSLDALPHKPAKVSFVAFKGNRLLIGLTDGRRIDQDDVRSVTATKVYLKDGSIVERK